MGSVSNSVNVKQSITEAVGSFASSKNKNLNAKALSRSKGVKKTAYISAYNPETNQFINGNLTDVAKQLKTSPATIKQRFSGGKAQFNKIKGFQVIPHKTLDNLVDYKQGLVKDTKEAKKAKAKPIFPGEAQQYFNKLYPEYKIARGKSRPNTFWGTNEIDYSVNLQKNNLDPAEISDIFTNVGADVVSTQGLKPNDKIRVMINDPNLDHFISTQLINVSDYNSGNVLQLIEDAHESSEEHFVIGPQTTISVVSIKLSAIKGSSSKKMDMLLKKYNDPANILSVEEKVEIRKHLDLFNKKSIITIKNPNDEMCCARACMTAVYRNMYGVDSNEYSNMRKGRPIQLEQAKELHMNTGVPEGPCGIEEVKIFEKFLGYQITIINGDFLNEVIYPDIAGKSYVPPVDDSKTIYLYYNKGHYDLVASNRVAGFFAKDNFCHYCKKCYKKKGEHRCIFKCNMCCRNDCEVLNIPFDKRKYNNQCKGCNRFFPTLGCLSNHLIPDKKGKNVCDKIWKCQDCKKIMGKENFPPATHKCGDYMCKNCGRLVRENHKCFMFPKEVNKPSEKYIFFDFEADISDDNHRVMFAISKYFDDPTPIEHSTIEEWCFWAIDKNHKGYTFIAHNGRGYDYKFIIRWIFDNTDYKPSTIFAGAKIMTMSIKELNIRFIDSLSFLTMPLKAFPKTFGEQELKKGYFPHWFNTKENWSYEGVVPDKDEFKYNTFKEKDRKLFLKWWQDLRDNDYVWNQQREMKEYCISDVDILRRCCIKFRDLYIKVAGIDPFQYITIAGVCMAIYKYNYVDITYPKRLKAFKDEWSDFSDGGNPQAEGWAEYHTAKEEFLKTTRHTIFKEKKIACFRYEEIDWMRKAFFGGRTNACKLIYKFEEGEEGMYSDITSLYPTVQYFDKYPKGHYKIIPEAEITEEILLKLEQREYFGFVDCDIIPPDNLYHPVLPKKGEKLTFDLLEKRGTWCSNEIYTALDKGYTLGKVYEIRYFRQTTKCLFKEYIKKFLKIKQEASGYPDWVETEDDKDKYIRQYEERQGIKLHKPDIVKNPGLRAIAKLCLNSLWGKFGQRLNLGETKIIDRVDEFEKIVTNPEYENINWIELGNNKMEISYCIKEQFVENDFNTNIAIACFTTSSARLRLYEALDTLGEQILYFDTDSCVYKYDPDNPDSKRLENGDLLGDWTDELEGEKMMGTFVSGGPKNYSYQTIDKDNKINNHTKVKGFNLNYETSQKVNHETIIDLVKQTLEDTTDYDYMTNKEAKLEQKKNKIGVRYDMIKRNQDHTLSSYEQKKDYGLVYTKRHILEVDSKGNYDTLPFGHKDI